MQRDPHVASNEQRSYASIHYAVVLSFPCLLRRHTYCQYGRRRHPAAQRGCPRGGLEDDSMTSIPGAQGPNQFVQTLSLLYLLLEAVVHRDISLVPT